MTAFKLFLVLFVFLSGCFYAIDKLRSDPKPPPTYAGFELQRYAKLYVHKWVYNLRNGYDSNDYELVGSRRATRSDLRGNKQVYRFTYANDAGKEICVDIWFRDKPGILQSSDYALPCGKRQWPRWYPGEWTWMDDELAKELLPV